MAVTRGGYVAIDDTEVDAESPVTESLAFRFRDNTYDALTNASTVAPADFRVALPERAKTSATDLTLFLGPDGAGGTSFRQPITNDQRGALDNASSPSAGNPFVTNSQLTSSLSNRDSRLQFFPVTSNPIDYNVSGLTAVNIIALSEDSDSLIEGYDLYFNVSDNRLSGRFGVNSVNIILNGTYARIASTSSLFARIVGTTLSFDPESGADIEATICGQV